MRRCRWLSIALTFFLVGIGLLGSHPVPVAASGAGGVTYYVAPLGTGDCTTGQNSATPLGSISDALTCAGSDNTTSLHPDRIFIAAGTYNETVNLTVNVNIVGIGGPVVNGSEPGAKMEGPSVITIAHGIKVGITGLTVMGGYAAQGSGIDNEGSLTLLHTAVTGNGSGFTGYGGPGGGIYNAGTLWGANDTITGNHTCCHGAGIYNTGTLIIFDTSITTNTTPECCPNGHGFGGGIYNTGTAKLVRVTISNNVGFDGAGGIDNEASGRIAIANSIIDSNGGAAYGGIANGGALTLIYSTVSNSGVLNDGGGIGNFSTGTMIVSSSRVIDNSAGSAGGGIVTSGKLLIDNSTIVSNTAGTTGGGIANGTSFGNGGTVTLIRSTVSNNNATQMGGGIYDNQGTVTLITSAVSSNTPDNCAPPNAVPGC